jgi:hypothetical protein
MAGNDAADTIKELTSYTYGALRGVESLYGISAARTISHAPMISNQLYSNVAFHSWESIIDRWGPIAEQRASFRDVRSAAGWLNAAHHVDRVGLLGVVAAGYWSGLEQGFTLQRDGYLGYAASRVNQGQSGFLKVVLPAVCPGARPAAVPPTS